MLEDNPEFKGLLEEEAPFPNVSAELPGVTLEEVEEGKYQVVINEPKPAFETLATTALENPGIDDGKWIHATRAAADAADSAGVVAVKSNSPRLIEANKDKIVYKITFNLPDEGIILPDDNNAELPDMATGVTPKTSRYPPQSCRSVVGNQPYNAHTP